ASSIRKQLELSTTTHPALAAMGAYSLEIPLPALNNAMSMPPNELRVNSCTGTSWPRNCIFLPADRAEASNVSLLSGKFRLASVFTISTPTAPVAPTIPTCGVRFIKNCHSSSSTASGQRRCLDGPGFIRDIGHAHFGAWLL